MYSHNYVKPVGLSQNMKFAEVFRRTFSASSVALVRQKHLKRINRLHKHWAKELFRPKPEYVDPVLGRERTPFLERIRAEIALPTNLLGGMDPENTSRLLFGAELAQQERTGFMHPQSIATSEARMREILSRILTLENSSTKSSKDLAVQLAVKEFGRDDGDTGSSEVQAAVWTIRIQFLAQHVKQQKQDLQSKIRLEHMVQKRRNILLYLKRKNPKKYMWTIEKLGLSDDAVTAEFHMSRRYLWDTQFYGDRTLPLKKTKKDTKIQRKLHQKREKALRYLAHNNPEALEGQL